MKESIDAQLDSQMLNDSLVDNCTKSPFIVAHVNTVRNAASRIFLLLHKLICIVRAVSAS